MSKSTLAIAGIAGLLLGGVLLGNMMATSKAEDALNELQAEMAATGSGNEFVYGDVSASFLSSAIEVSDISVTYMGESIGIKNILLEGVKEDPDEMETFLLSAEGINFGKVSHDLVSKRPNSPLEMIAKAAILDSKDFDFRIDLDIDRSESSVSLKELTLTGEDLGEISLSTTIISPDLMSNYSNYTGAMKVTDFALSAQDDGLTDLWFEHSATRTNTDVDDVREKLVKNGEKALKRSKGFEKEFVEAALALIDGDKVTVMRETETALEINPLRLTNQRYIKKFGEEANLTFVID